MTAAVRPQSIVPPLPSVSTEGIPLSDVTNGSHVAAAAAGQAGSLVGMLSAQLKGGTLDGYTRLVNRGVLEDAIAFSDYASKTLRSDQTVDNDQFAALLDSGVSGVLKGVKQLGLPNEKTLAQFQTELELARSSARNVEFHLDRS